MQSNQHPVPQTLIKLTLPEVRASGKRTAWWFYVTGVTHSGVGIGRLRGTHLSAGECELSPMDVVCLFRPIGAAKSEERTVDIMFVDPATQTLKGYYYGVEFDRKAPNNLLLDLLREALMRCKIYNETNEKLREILMEVEGLENNAQQREKLTEDLLGAVGVDYDGVRADLSAEILAYIPAARHIGIGRTSTGLRVSFLLPCRAIETRLIRCAVVGVDTNGDSDCFYLRVRVPADYKSPDELDTSVPSHYTVARQAASDNLCHTEMAPVFDSETDRWESLLQICDWPSTTIYNLKGEVENE